MASHVPTIRLALALDEATSLVQRTHDAISDWQTLKKSDPEVAQFYALCLFSWNNWKAR